MKRLKHAFPEIIQDRGRAFGGNQSWLPYGFLRRSGCGVIGMTNVLLYLHCFHENAQTELFYGAGRNRFLKTDYLQYALEIWKRYLPVIPGFGINGLSLMIGMNAYFVRYRLPYRAVWKVSGRKIRKNIDEMLSMDIPVILAAGPNFPNLFGKKKLDLYIRTKEGTYIFATATKAHYMTVTAVDEQWMEISSWGKRYYINIREFEEYVKKYSSYIVSNILYVRKKEN